jgi:putative polyhydroxyalkanoate system protein
MRQALPDACKMDWRFPDKSVRSGDHSAMANIHIERQHSLELDDAKSQVESIAENLKKDLQADYQWKGNKLLFKRSGASGSIDVNESTVVVNVQLSMALGLMKGKIEKGINQSLDKLLGA